MGSNGAQLEQRDDTGATPFGTQPHDDTGATLDGTQLEPPASQPRCATFDGTQLELRDGDDTGVQDAQDIGVTFHMGLHLHNLFESVWPPL